MPAPQTTNDRKTEFPRLGPDDPRYRAMVEKRFNKRLVGSTERVISAVQEAVSEGRRLTVTRAAWEIKGDYQLGASAEK